MHRKKLTFVLGCIMLVSLIGPSIQMAKAMPPGDEMIWSKTDVREQDLFFNIFTTKTVISSFTVELWGEFGGGTYLQYSYSISYPSGGMIYVVLYHHSWRYDPDPLLIGGPRMDSHSYFWWHNSINTNWDTNLYHFYIIEQGTFSFTYSHVKL